MVVKFSGIGRFAPLHSESSQTSDPPPHTIASCCSGHGMPECSAHRPGLLSLNTRLRWYSQREATVVCVGL
eukprot:1639082-Rhodomonas_salina.3